MTMENFPNITPDEALAAVPEHLRSSGKVNLPSEAEAEEFTRKVDDITRLINGLHEGTLPPEYIDRVMEEKQEKQEKEKKKADEKKKKDEEAKTLTPEREAELRERAAELEASYKRKIKARERYEEYVKDSAEETSAGTDYAKWDMWCPSDEEDELINKLTLPNSAEFKAMEKDIDDRHAKQVKGRQIAERCRVKGNEEYKNGQWAAAYDWYTEGLDHEKPNVALNSNAAMASIKMGCYVQAIEHADKALRICDFLLEKPDHPLKVKALQRKATARLALKHYKEAVDALAEASELEPGNTEVAKQLAKAIEEYEEDKKERQLHKALAGDGKGEGAGASSMATLRRLEELVKGLRSAGSGSKGSVAAGLDPDAAVAAASPTGLGKGLPGKQPSGKPASHQTSDAESSARELIPLLDADDSNRVYLRQCGGIDALVGLVRKGKAGGVSDGALEQAIGALRAACINPRNTSEAASKGMYPALVAVAASREGDTALEARGAAALLLGNCTTDEDERKAISKALAGLLPGVFPLLSAGKSIPLVQASALVLLQNCAVDKQVREAFSEAQGDSGPEAGTPLGEIAELLSAPQAVLRERSASLLGNLLMDASLRQRGGVAGAIACRVLNALAAGQKKDQSASGAGEAEAEEVILPLLAALSNCLLEGAAVEAALSGTGAPQQRIAALSGLFGHCNPAVVGRAAGCLARLARQDLGRKAFVDCPALNKAVQALVKATAEVSDPDSPLRGAHAEVIGACCRALALAMTAGGASATSSAVAAGAIKALLGAVAASGTPDAAAGNAALALSEVARYPEHLAALREVDAVEPLVTCAHKRSEKTTQKNAAIALARMAQDPACLQRLKDLHGLEIIYQTAR